MNISASEAREGWADIVNRVAYGRERVVIERHGKPVAVLMSFDDAEALEGLEDRLDALEAQEAKAEWERGGRRTYSLEQVLTELDEESADAKA